jgi:glutamine synthetase
MAKRQIIPAFIDYSSRLATAVSSLKGAGATAGPQAALLTKVCGLIDTISSAVEILEAAAAKAGDQGDSEKQAELFRDEVIPAMDAVRAPADELETIVDADLWPLPTYAEMLFIK